MSVVAAVGTMLALGSPVLAIDPDCPCEMNGDGAIDVTDILAYLALWFPSAAGAERTGDDPAMIDVHDLLAFLECWFAPTDCATVESVVFEAYQNTIDDNPNAGGGKRVFVGDQEPGDVFIRNTVKVKATVDPAVAGVTVHFRPFDVDDPSSAIAPVDRNDGGGAKGDDNRGRMDGLRILPVTPRITSRGGYDGHLRPVGGDYADEGAAVSAVTDATGVATVEFALTFQPGDNFRVAASSTQAEINELRDDDATTGPEVPAGNAADLADFSGKLTPMLTVWRKLRVEFDSMGPADAVGPDEDLFGIVTDTDASGATAVRPASLTDAGETWQTNDQLKGALLDPDTDDILTERFEVVASTASTVIVNMTGGARGAITGAVPANIADAETFTISDGGTDGTVTAITFEFQKNAVAIAAGNVEVNIVGAAGGAAVETAMADAINAAPAIFGVTAFTLEASRNAGITAEFGVALINDAAGAAGNVALAETVANAGFRVAGMGDGAVPAVAKAQGRIFAAAPADIVDGETFTISDGGTDGAVTSVTFEFQKNATAVAGGNREVDIRGAATASDVKNAISAAIRAAQPALGVGVGPLPGVTLKNDNNGNAGNVVIGETVANGGFIVTGMSGGQSIATKATGQLHVVPAASILDGETFTIRDGNPTDAITFEFDRSGDGVREGNVEIDVPNGATAEQVEAAVHAAINAAPVAFGVTSTRLTGATSGCALENDVAGPLGNMPLVDTVVNGGFSATGMAGGSISNAAASGSISLVLIDHTHIVDGETFTISDGGTDGVVNAVTFEFQKNGTPVGAGNTPVNLVGAGSAHDVEARILAAINGVPALGVSATASREVVLLNANNGEGGNVQITETVASDTFVVVGMLGGKSDITATSAVGAAYSIDTDDVAPPGAPPNVANIDTAATLDILNLADMYPRAYIQAVEIPSEIDVTDEFPWDRNLSLPEAFANASATKDAQVSATYWAVLVLRVYDPGFEHDNDPDIEPAVLGLAPAKASMAPGIFASHAAGIIFTEAFREVLPDAAERALGEATTVAHELTHNFGCHHFLGNEALGETDDDIMTEDTPVPVEKRRLNDKHRDEIRTRLAPDRTPLAPDPN